MKTPKEKSAYLAESSFSAIFLIASYLVFLSYVLVKALVYHSFAASDGALIAIAMVLYAGVIAGLFFAESGSMAKGSAYALLAAFSLYEAVTNFNYLYTLGGEPLLDVSSIILVVVGVFLLFGFLLVGLSTVLPEKKLIFLKAARIFYDASAVLFAISAILSLVAGSLLFGLLLFSYALLSGGIPFALKALDLLQEALKKGL